MDGNKSSDPDPGDSIASYTWTQVDGPDIGFGTQSSATVQFTAPTVNEDTVLTFSLGVSDTFLASSTTTTSITVKADSNNPPPDPNPNTPPIAVAKWTTPIGRAYIGSTMSLDGSQSYDPDIGNEVVGYEWKKTAPSDQIVKNTFSFPTTMSATFDLPNYIPTQFTSLVTPPKMLPVEFSLDVVDTHSTKSTEPAIISLNVECFEEDTAAGEHARDILNKAINHPIGKILVQTVDNFRYFLAGKGDLEGRPLEVSGKGIPDPLPVMWLENTREFKLAQTNLAKQYMMT